MNRFEEKRLKKLQMEGEKENARLFMKKLTYPDILLLLREDEKTRQLIADIAKNQAVNKAEDGVNGTDEPVARSSTQHLSNAAVEIKPTATMPAMPPPPDPLRKELSPELNLLQLVKADSELCLAWLGEAPETEGRQLVRLIAAASQWDEVVMPLWDRLAGRCKKDKREAAPDERQILQVIVDLHNLIWREKAARFQSVEMGVGYDYRLHEKSPELPDGKVIGEWLPGLFNAAGELKKKPLVSTEKW